jgi:hypothetical protein
MACNCPDGYQLVNGECVKIVEVPAQFSGDVFNIGAAGQDAVSSILGLFLHEDITSKPKPIKNISGASFPNFTDNTNAPVNLLISGLRSKLWGCYTSEGACYNPASVPTRQNISQIQAFKAGPPTGSTVVKFEYCVSIPQTKQYMMFLSTVLSIAAPTTPIYKIYINNVLTFSCTQNNHLFDTSNVFPMTLPAGDLKITIEISKAYFSGNYINSTYRFAFEIYNIDIPTFQAQLTIPITGFPNCGNQPSDINSYVLFSTKDSIGTTMPNLNSGNYTCTQGTLIQGDCGILNMCEGLDFQDTTDPICYFTLNNCITNQPYEIDGEVVYLKYTGICDIGLCPEDIDYPVVISSIDSPVIGEIIEGCLTLTNTSTIPTSFFNYEDVINNSTSVETFPSCAACNPEYYTLNDCCTNEPYQVDGEILYLSYNGVSEPGVAPDDLINLIITNIYAEAGIPITGCLKLIELQEEPTTGFITSYANVVQEVETVATCEDCQLCEYLYYTLNDCCTDEPYKFNGEVLYLEYTGFCEPGACPDDLINLIITRFYQEGGAFIEGCFKLTQLQNAPTEPTSNYGTIITAADTVINCEDCQICITTYKLTDCSNSENVVYTCSDLSQYTGFVIKLQNCEDTCWSVEIVEEGIDPKPAGTVTEVKLNCEECLPKPPEPVIPTAQPRKVRPGYFIKNPCLSTEYVEKVNCTFSNQVYNQMTSVRYGISSCCEVDVNKWDIKKQIVDFELITIPKEEVHTPRTCYCYTITVTTGTANFKYINCEGDWCKVTLTENTANVCSQNKPQADCVELGVIYEINSSTTECETNDDCEQN